MLQRVKTSVSNLPLKKKIFSITLISIILLSASALIGIQITSSSNKKLLYNTIAGSLSYSATDISNRLDNIETMSYMILSNAGIQSNLSIIKDSHDYIKRTQAFQELNAVIPDYYQSFKANNLSYINLYNDYFTSYSNKYYSDRVPDQIHEKLVQESEAKEGAVCWISRYNDQYGLFLGRDIRRIKQTRLDHLGTLLVCVDIDAMVKSATEFSSQYENASYLLIDGDDLIYHSKNFTEEEAVSIQSALDSSYKILNLNNHNYFAVKGRIPDYDWDYICLVSYDAMTSALRLSQFLCISIILLCVIFTLLLSRRLINSVVYHFNTLLDKMKAFGKDETTIPNVDYDYSARNDELGLLHRQFDHMAYKIQHLIQVNYVNELLKKEAQLKALENQINPHFLYNTLESVNWRAKAIGETEISSMVEALGALLRVTLNKKESIFTLKQELELVLSYMTIQKIRFEDRLEFSVQVPDSLLAATIPKLTIQPLVENAIHYGLEEMTEECSICVSAACEGNRLRIYVTNSGSLFEENLLEKLKTNEILPHGFGIGLLNIDKRLKLTFGDEYGLTLYNQDDLAVAMVTIPKE
ncbi:sensor histidine kinase [Clostridium sp. MCC353]|uniref:sensor histidine kinase n=1 Tax=Clostridium sp. MCC353 TaxID=2592646 RepID=UPI001C0307ED|nr:sensor histidine kinase [Clostridium sp. MCC353]MBT9777912.1 sensor histidine kinase [Clostridium sp. MCC353]